MKKRPGTFLTFINYIFRDPMDHSLIVYLDHILIYSKDQESHDNTLGEVFQRFKINHLFINEEKSTLNVPRVTYLGYMISHDSISSDLKKVNILERWPKPRTTHELQQFTGFVNYYRKFIDGYAKISIPLYESIKKNNVDNGKKQ
jgi:Reverse transcriptase (RNA-dependent DNA polymerase)